MRIEHSQLAMFLLWVYGEVVSDKRFKADRVVRLKGCTRVLLVALAPPPPCNPHVSLLEWFYLQNRVDYVKISLRDRQGNSVECSYIYTTLLL